jgi:hypothetical protein
MSPYDANYALLGSIAFMAFAAIIVGVAGYITFATLWRFRHEPAPGTLGALFARQGVDWARLASLMTVEQFATGLDRCRECGAKADCGRWLAAGNRDGYQRFCPNAAVVERISKAVATR